jgi:hypothetical protein
MEQFLVSKTFPRMFLQLWKILQKYVQQCENVEEETNRHTLFFIYIYIYTGL